MARDVVASLCLVERLVVLGGALPVLAQGFAVQQGARIADRYGLFAGRSEERQGGHGLARSGHELTQVPEALEIRHVHALAAEGEMPHATRGPERRGLVGLDARRLRQE